MKTNTTREGEEGSGGAPGGGGDVASPWSVNSELGRTPLPHYSPLSDPFIVFYSAAQTEGHGCAPPGVISETLLS